MAEQPFERESTPQIEDSSSFDNKISISAMIRAIRGRLGGVRDAGADSLVVSDMLTQENVITSSHMRNPHYGTHKPMY